MSLVRDPRAFYGIRADCETLSWHSGIGQGLRSPLSPHRTANIPPQNRQRLGRLRGRHRRRLGQEEIHEIFGIRHPLEIVLNGAVPFRPATVPGQL